MNTTTNHYLSNEELLARLKDAESKVKIGERYYHYKHPEKLYTVERIAMLEATEEPAVLYTSEDGITWIRPISEFLSQNEVDGKLVNKFTLVE